MKLVTIRCDRCGETIETGRAVVALHAGPTPPAWQTDPETGRPAVDLCGPCLAALSAWLWNRPAPPDRPRSV